MGNKVTGTYSGFYGTGMTEAEARNQKAAVERLNATVGAKNRQVEVKQMSNGRYFVEETMKSRK